MNSFVDLSIIECNRVNSEEAKTGNNENPALWHNKLGTGITINPGDRIQVEQCFVNEVGAGDQIIEFLGNSLNETKTITYLSASLTNASDLMPQGAEAIDYTEITEDIPLFDNKASIVINYYKTMNGENYIQMPRKFTCLESVINNASSDLARNVWKAQEGSTNLGGNASNYGLPGGLPYHQVPYFVRNSRNFYYADADYYYFSGDLIEDTGANAENRSTQDFFKLRNDGSKYTIFVRKNNIFRSYNCAGTAVTGPGSNEVTLNASTVRGTPEVGNVMYNLAQEQFIEFNFVTAYNASTGVVTFKQDVSGLTDGDNVIFLDSEISKYATGSYWPNEPSDIEYLEYTERLDLEVGIGRNSPSNVANDITNQFRKTGNFNKIYYNRTLNEPNFTPQRAISGYINSNTYKIFNAMNAYDMNNTHYDTFNGSHSLYNASQFQSLPQAGTMDWINSLQFIGVKRPDFYKFTRNFNGSLDTSAAAGAFGRPCIRGGLNASDNNNLGPNFIRTNILWTDNNLELFKELFRIQKNYPELFTAPYNDYGNGAQHWSGSGTRGIISPSQNRFIHINPYLRNVADTGILGKLGTDDISASTSFFNSEESNYISLPLFLYFDENQEENGPDINDGTNVGQLTYGFGYKDTFGGVDYLSFYTGNIGGYQPPLDYFDRNASAGSINGASPGGTSIQGGTLIGMDTHWTAYGTAVVGLCDGWVDYPFNMKEVATNDYSGPDYENLWAQGINGTWAEATSKTQSPALFTDQLKKVYLGANEPLLNFDNVSGRFNLSQLHTPEYIGNDVRSGGTPSASNAITIPINEKAGDKVYKINKRITNINWTTAMVPYTTNFIQTASGTEKYDLSLMNPNFEQYCIFDSKSGITIKDFGYTESAWQNGMWGILGFDYNQFNASITASNTFNSRISEQNVKQLNFASTNADITSGQSIEYITNDWGVPMYNSQIPAASIWYGVGRNNGSDNNAIGTRIGFAIQNFPPITEEQNSILLVAKNQPKKMLKPYFCIRSDLIDKANYTGGPDSGQLLPVVAVVNKINGYGDFYFSNENPLEFVATQRKTITSITTSIHYPDQSFAEVNNDSAVIYKISKNQLASSDILAQIQANINKKN